MNNALVFSKDSEYYGKIVTAQQIEQGQVSRDLEFVDVEYTFKVIFVKRAKDGTNEHFRLYYSRQDYNNFSEEQRSRFDILKQLHHYHESAWHKHWEDNFPDAEKEKVIKAPENVKEMKRADVYLRNTDTCVEFQHSYIALDFKERNDFYDRLGMNVIWLYDLTQQNVDKKDDGSFEILEDNSKGFFKVSDFPENLMKHPVLIQVKGNRIFLVDKLERKEINSDYQSTIRFFLPVKEYSEEEFISSVNNSDLLLMSEAFLKKNGRYDMYLAAREKIKNDRLVAKNAEGKRDEAARLAALRKAAEEAELIRQKNQRTAQEKAAEENRIRLIEAEKLNEENRKKAAEQKKIKDKEKKELAAERRKLYEEGKLEENIIAEALTKHKCPICGSGIVYHERAYRCCSLFACGFIVRPEYIKYLKRR